MLPTVAVFAILVFGCGYLLLRYQQRAIRHVFRCAECSQQIRFTSAQRGAKGRCPRCWEPITLPSDPQAVVPSATARSRTRHAWFRRVAASTPS